MRPVAVRIPPGRAGRLRLRHRLEVAQRGAELLERKLRALQKEQQRRTRRVRDSGDEWTRRAGEADTWLLRAALLTGQRGLQLARPHESAVISVEWANTMGLRYPAQATCTLPSRMPDSPGLPSSAALIDAEKAYGAALAAAVRHAADRAALRAICAEVTATRHRVRALRRRWIPRLEDALSIVELELEEQERAEGLRRRWAAQR